MLSRPPDIIEWDRDMRKKWTKEKIENIQKSYRIEDEQIIHKYTVVGIGFAAELDDEQLYGLDQDKRIRTITHDVKFRAI